MSKLYSGLIALIISCTTAGSVSASDVGEERFGYGNKFVGFQAGWGNGVSLGFMGQGDGRDVEYLALFPQFGIGISDPLGDSSWYRGVVDIVFEGEFFTSFRPNSGYSAGVAALLRYDFLISTRFVPYIEAGLGIGTLDFDLVDQSDGIIFYPQVGAGMHYFFHDSVSFDLSWRLHHMSNAGINKPNNSINTNLFLIGFSYFLE